MSRTEEEKEGEEGGGWGGKGETTLENMNRNLTVFTGQTPGNFAWELRDLFERASVWSTVSRTNGPTGRQCQTPVQSTALANQRSCVWGATLWLLG